MKQKITELKMKYEIGKTSFPFVASSSFFVRPVNRYGYISVIPSKVYNYKPKIVFCYRVAVYANSLLTQLLKIIALVILDDWV